ncbi:replication endonuclease [Thalassotalea sp. ND16A]|uniref:replication endonuclease n=1 Tax=Thalassotalea sp. ND16A TaxID=1535422 RepID=UPI00051D8635|nr:replication endonuclease [Thalassotalea sp. ND16A]KGJ98131.1 hypothetical protein ND16A_0936 [Thalassotalea sp. ND16A]
MTSPKSLLMMGGADNAAHWHNQTNKLPYPLQLRFARRYANHFSNNVSRDGKSVEFTANSYLQKTLAKIKPRFPHIFNFMTRQSHPWRELSNAKRMEKRAENIAMEMNNNLVEMASELTGEYIDNLTATYEYLAAKCDDHCVTAPFSGVELDNSELLQHTYEVAIRKMTNEKWWKGKLKRFRLQALEWLEIATGEVSKASGNPYASRVAVSEYRARQTSCAEWMSVMELKADCYNEDTGRFFENTISLEDAYKSGMANPENRRNELMLRMRHMEEYADEVGYVGMFYTITAPSAYHANSDKWNGKSPKDSNAYFNKMWAKIRSKLGRRNLSYFGVRVAEPHADGTPHWHMALFMREKDQQEITAILRKYAITEDRDELYQRYQNREKLFKAHKKARKSYGYKKSKGIKAKAPYKFYRTFTPRFDVVRIDKKYGSATSYIAKYISKNIDGFKMADHEDAETEKPISESINPVAAWASTWNIRQFQFQYSPSVTVYRELRKIRKAVKCPEMEKVRSEADAGNWLGFVKAMGGMNSSRQAKFKTAYQEIPQGNEYGELVRKVKGVTSTDFSVISRTTNWALSKVEGEAGNLSWTCGNNCTLSVSEGKKLQRLGFSTGEIDWLGQGKLVYSDNGIAYQIRNNELRQIRTQKSPYEVYKSMRH